MPKVRAACGVVRTTRRGPSPRSAAVVQGCPGDSLPLRPLVHW